MIQRFQRTPGHLVRRAHQRHNTIFAEETAGHDVTAPQFAALRALDATPDVDQTTLSEIIAYDRSTIGGLVDRLEAKGLVRRTAGTHDRRTKRLSLTTAGRRLLRELDPKVRRVSERMLERLDPAERSTLLALLERVVLTDEPAEGSTAHA